MDTLDLAKQEKEKFAPWELEVSYGGEADLHRHLQDCPKNPGHLSFIPIGKLQIDDLPSHYRDPDLFGVIQAFSELTVRLSIRWVSHRRPNNILGIKEPYPFSGSRGSNMLRVGTGWVKHVDLPVIPTRQGQTADVDVDENAISSSGLASLRSRLDRLPQATIHIKTATHVVFDYEEGEHTTCYFFYDEGNTPERCAGVVTLTEPSNVATSIEKDSCSMTFSTHNLDLARRLQLSQESWTRHQRSLAKRSLFSSGTRPPAPLAMCPSEPTRHKSLVVIVSHPHGCSKQVSIGQLEDFEELKKERHWMQHIYSTATCPGSSGAGVLMVSADLMPSLDVAHGGQYLHRQGCNYSVYGLIEAPPACFYPLLV